MTTTTDLPAPGGPALDGDDDEASVLVEPGRVVVGTPTGRRGEAHVTEQGERVVLDFRLDGPLPDELSSELVRQAFSLPAVRSRRPVLVCIPRRDGGVFTHARRRVAGARTRAAGVTCLIEGHVAGVPHSGARGS